MRAILVLVVFSSLSVGAVQGRGQEPVRYSVRVEDPTARIYHVEAEFPATGAMTKLSLPSWTPGHYSTENYARYVGRFAAFDAGSEAELRWDKLDKDSWRIESAGASRIRVSFDFFTDTLNLSGSILHDDFGFFNGTNLFLYPESGYEFESEVSFELPEGWRIATELQATDRPTVFRASDYHELVDNPTFLGRFGIDSVRADGRWIRLAVYPATAMRDPARQLALDALQKIAESIHSMYGEPPYERYTTLVYLADGIPYLAGLEHANSHLDILPSIAFQRPRLLFTGFVYRLLAHEYYHAWNVKRIRPVQLWPYDYEREQPTPLLWVSEGITDYYAQVILARTGIWSQERFWQGIEDAIGNIEAQPAHEAVEDASLNTWMDPTFIPEDYYYDKGALLGLLLDIRIRDATANRHSLDDVMAQLYREHYLHGSGFSTEDFLSYVGEHVGDEVARAFYRDHVDGREPLPFQQTLALAAMRYEADTIVEPFLGVAVTPLQDGDLRVSTVQPGSSAARAGLQPGDILISVGDVELEDQSWGGEFRRLYSGAGGERIEIHYERNGRRISDEATIETRTRYVHRLQPVTNASERARSIRAGILEGDV